MLSVTLPPVKQPRKSQEWEGGVVAWTGPEWTCRRKRMRRRWKHNVFMMRGERKGRRAAELLRSVGAGGYIVRCELGLPFQCEKSYPRIPKFPSKMGLVGKPARALSDGIKAASLPPHTHTGYPTTRINLIVFDLERLSGARGRERKDKN